MMSDPVTPCELYIDRPCFNLFCKDQGIGHLSNISVLSVLIWKKINLNSSILKLSLNFSMHRGNTPSPSRELQDWRIWNFFLGGGLFFVFLICLTKFWISLPPPTLNLLPTHYGVDLFVKSLGCLCWSLLSIFLSFLSPILLSFLIIWLTCQISLCLQRVYSQRMPSS